MYGKNKKYGGFLTTEIITSLGITALIMIGLALSLHGFKKFNHYQMVRQRCISAAQAQLECISAAGRPIASEDFKRLWPKLQVSINNSAGTGQWVGLKLVEVTASGKSLSKQVKIKLSRYILQVPDLQDNAKIESPGKGEL